MKTIMDFLGRLALKTNAYSKVSTCFVFVYEPDLPESEVEEEVY